MRKTTKAEYIDSIHTMDLLMGREERRTGLTKLLLSEIKDLHAHLLDMLAKIEQEQSKEVQENEYTPMTEQDFHNWYAAHEKPREDKRMKFHKPRRPRRARTCTENGKHLSWSSSEGQSRSQRRVGTKSTVRNARKGRVNKR